MKMRIRETIEEINRGFSMIGKLIQTIREKILDIEKRLDKLENDKDG